MDLTSDDFDDGATMPARLTCDGGEDMPELRWSGVPAGVVELALTCEDPDAPSGTFVHWVAWGLDPARGRVGGAAGPPPHQGINSFGRVGYGGACPPPGDTPHHYNFALYGVRTHLDLVDGATEVSDLRAAVEPALVATATLTGTYARNG